MRTKQILLLLSWLPLSLLGQNQRAVPYTYAQLYQFLDDADKNKDIWRTAEVYALLGDFHLNAVDYENAFKSYTKSIDFYEGLGDSSRFYQVKISLAEYYQQLDFFEDGIKEYREAIEYYKKEKKLPQLARSYLGLSAIHRKAGDFQEELAYLKKCEDINRAVKDTLLEIVYNINRSNTYQKMERYDEAMKSSQRALKLSYVTQNEKYLSLNLFRVGLLSQFKGNFPSAIDSLKKSLIYTPLGYADQRRSIHKQLSECYSAIEDYNLAYDELIKYSVLNDSILNADKLEIANQANRQYKIERRDKLIKTLEKDKKVAEVKVEYHQGLVYSFIAAFIAILISIYFIVRFYQQQISAKEIIARQKEEINRQKITELENNVKIESMYAMMAGQEAERERVAKDLHDSLGGLLSTVKLQFNTLESKLRGIENIGQYRKANQLLDDACQEVRDISRNMQPSSLLNLGLVPAVKDLINRVNDSEHLSIDFQYYGLEAKLENSIALTVYRIVQELFHNSLKHAQASEILIQLTKKNGDLIIMVEDDGVGFDVEGVKKGMGSENILSRVNYLKGDYSVHSVKGKGTTTLITVPLGKK
ncbi:MAG: sensor histidine kinase [Bacteroidota bacterium]